MASARDSLPVETMRRREMNRSAALARARIERHLEALRRREAVAVSAVRDAHAASWQAISEYVQVVSSTLGLVELEVQIADAAAAADRAEDADTFAAAVEAELRAWHLYLERLQARAALETGDARLEAEDAIRELRRRRLALARSLEQIRAASGDSWRDLKPEAAAARLRLANAVDGTRASADHLPWQRRGSPSRDALAMKHTNQGGSRGDDVDPT
jgi:hypothetical protein